MAGGITLCQIYHRLRMLEIACHACPRFGRLNVTNLVMQHGPDKCLLELKNELAANCPKRQPENVSIYDQCKAHYPQLPDLFL